MKISPIYSNNLYNQKCSTKINQPDFKCNCRVITDRMGNLQYRSTTSFFRGDLNWTQMAKFFGDKFKNVDKVNVLNYGCSSGEETYSIIMSLIKTLGKQAEKFFPIIAKDIDGENIDDAKNGVLYANIMEKTLIENLLSKKETTIDSNSVYQACLNHYANNIVPQIEKLRDINKYVRIKVNEDNNDKKWAKYRDKNVYEVKVQKFLKERANFSIGNILYDIHSVPDKNTIIFARNMWPYIRKDQQTRLLNFIYNKFHNKNSYIVFGDYDDAYSYTSMVPYYNGTYTDNGSYVKFCIDRYNFQETGLRNIFKI